MFGYNIADILMNIPIALLSLSVHECAHGWMSTKLGDPTPKYQGRLTLNPLVHLDPVGTLLMILTGFGWARPVQVNPGYYKNTKRGMALVALAGPLSNLILAVIANIFWIALTVFSIFTGIENSIINVLLTFFQTFFILNISLMVFNLIPIPPLDGSKVLGMFLPNRIYYKVLQYERYSMMLIMLLSLSGVLENILRFGVEAVAYLIEMPLLFVLDFIISFL